MDLLSVLAGPWHRQRSPYRLIFSLAYANVLWWNVTLAQMHMTGGFGPCLERPLPYAPADVVSLPLSRSGTPGVAVLGHSPATVILYSYTAGAGFQETTEVPLAVRARTLLSTDLERDDVPELLVPVGESSTLLVLHKTGKAWRVDSITCPVKPERVVVADVNNDRRNDILLFGRSMAGVATLLGQKNGRFTAGPILFADVSVSDLCVMDINGDGITDVFLLNWVKNQLMLFYGISNAVFSEQITVDLPGEPAALSQAHVRGGRRVTIAVSLPAERRVAVVDGSITGELSVRQQLPCPGAPDQVVLADLNGDQRLDIVAGTNRGIVVRKGLAEGGFGSATVFGFASGVTPWALFDADRNGLADLVIADATHRRLVLALNGTQENASPVSSMYAAGLAPSAVTIADVDDDGHGDIVLGSSQLPTLSILFNAGNGKFTGLSGVPAPVRAHQVVNAGGSREGTTLVLADHSSDRVGVITLAHDAQTVASYSMPAGKEPFIMAAREEGERRMNMVVRTRDPRRRSVSLSLYEQIPDRQFLEHHLHPQMPGRIVAAALISDRASGPYDLVFVSHDARTARAQISRATGSPDFTFSSISILAQYRDSLSATRRVEVLSSGGSNTMRVLVYRDFPSYSLAIASADSTAPSQRWLNGVHPVDPDGFIVRDVNGDGREDVVFLSDAPRALKVSYQARDGSLLPPATVRKADDVTTFTLGELRTRGEVDAVLVHGGEGTVELLFNPFTGK